MDRSDNVTDLEAQRRVLRRLALHLAPDDATAEDLVQDVWVASLEDSPAAVRDLTAWLREVMRNLARRQGRQRQLRQDVEQMAVRTDLAASGDLEVDQRSTFEFLRSEIERIGEPYRSPLLMRFFEQRSFEELATALDRPIGTVKSQVRRGLEQLRATLDVKHGGDRSQWACLLLGTAFPEVDETLLLPNVRGGAGPRPVSMRAMGATLAVVGGLFFAAWMMGTGDRPPEVTIVRGASTPVTPAQQDPQFSSTRTLIAEIGPDSEFEKPVVPQVVPETRRLEVFLVHADGMPAGAVNVRAWVGDDEPFAESRTEGARVAVDVPIGEGFDGHVSVVARADDEAWSNQYLVDLPIEGREVEVISGGAPQAISGTVTDADGNPLAGVFIGVDGPRIGVSETEDGVARAVCRQVVHSDAEGRFLVEYLPVRRQQVFLAKAPFRSEQRFVEQTDLLVELDVTLARGATVVGVARLAGGGLAGHARVWEPERGGLHAGLFDGTVAADAQGRFELGGFEAGSHRVFAASADGLSVATTIVDLHAVGTSTWDPILEPAIGIRVRVQEQDGTPVEAAGVLLISQRTDPPWGEVELSTASGHAFFPHVPEGPLALAVKRHITDSNPSFMELGMRPSEVEVVATLTPQADRRGTIQGTLLDAAGEPFTSAVVMVEGVDGRDFRVACNADNGGHFEVAGVDPGRWSLWAIVADHGAVNMGEHEVLPGEHFAIDPVRASIPGRVSIEWGERLPSPERPLNLWVSRFEGDAQRRVRVIDAWVDTLELLPGSYGIAPVVKQRVDDVVTFEIRAGEEVRIVMN